MDFKTLGAINLKVLESPGSTQELIRSGFESIQGVGNSRLSKPWTLAIIASVVF
jgi:hypothetical protein